MTQISPQPPRPTGARRFVQPGLWLACGVVLLIQLVMLGPSFLDPMRIANDYRQNFFWMAALRDPGLFLHDYVAQYARDFNPPGILLAYWLGAHAGISPFALSKVLTAVVYSTFLVGVYFLGRRFGRERGPITALVFLLLVLVSDRYFVGQTVGGFARTFAFPFQVWILWALLSRRYWLAMGLGFAAVFLHPQTFLITFAILGVIFAGNALRLAQRRRRLARALVPFTALLLVGATTSLWLQSRSQAMVRDYGRMVDANDMRHLREYRSASPTSRNKSSGGRWWREQPNGLHIAALEELSGAYLLNARGEWESNSGLAFAWVLLGSCVVFVATSGVQPRKLWRHAPLLVGVVIVIAWFLLCYALLTRVYFPNRFLRPMVPLLVMLWVADRVAAGPAPGTWLRRGWWAWVLALVITGVRGFSTDADILFEINLRPVAKVTQFLRTLPPNAVIAANPSGDADDISPLAERSIYVHREISHPLYWDFSMEMRRRTELVTDALVFEGSNRDQVRALRRDGVSHMVINKALYEQAAATPPAYPKGDQPYRDRMRGVLAGNAEGLRKFWLEGGAPWPMVYEDDQYRVFQIGPVTDLRPTWPHSAGDPATAAW